MQLYAAPCNTMQLHAAPCSASHCMCKCACVLLGGSSDRSFGISAVLTFAISGHARRFSHSGPVGSIWKREALEKTQQKQTWNVISRTATIALKKKRTARMATLLPRGRAAAELEVNYTTISTKNSFSAAVCSSSRGEFPSFCFCSVSAWCLQQLLC